MAVFGWVVLVLIGVVCLIVSLIQHAFAVDASGSGTWHALKPLITGAVVLYIAYINHPF